MHLNEFWSGGLGRKVELFAKGTFGTSASFLLLVMLNEAWIINLGVFIVVISLALARVGSWMGDEVDVHWIVFIGLFQVFAYAIIGYKVENLKKMCFLNCES